MSMRGYKVFNSDWTCQGFQYEVGEEYEMDEKPMLCKKGFHFCEKLAECFNYYRFNPENKVAEIEAYGEIISDIHNSKHCTNKIKIVRELSWYEVLDIVNTGKSNTGYYNSGDHNSGNWNSGRHNSGCCNSGSYNNGDYNSGDYNSGDWNSGDWNSGYHNSGCFNTTQAKIYMFDKPSGWTYKEWASCRARGILSGMPCRLRWLPADEMTEEEKEHNKGYETTGGYLKELADDEHKEAVNEWWRGLSEDNKREILNLPNFDAGIFEEITGIEVEENTAKRIVTGGEHEGATAWYECDKCGTVVDLEDSYCRHCGRRLEDKE